MPKYIYSCQECDHAFSVYHSPKEKLKNCPQCDTRDGLLRKVNKVFVNKTETGSNIKNVGDLTKEFIEDNRDILKDYKKELGNNEFDNTTSSD